MAIDNFELTNKRITKPFNEASRSEIYSKLNGRTSPTVEMRRLEMRVNHIRAKARAHYARNSNQWVSRTIGKITQNRHKPAGTSYQPSGWLRNVGRTNDLAAIRRAAEQRVGNSHQQRMGRINGIYDRMVENIVQRAGQQEKTRTNDGGRSR